MFCVVGLVFWFAFVFAFVVSFVVGLCLFWFRYVCCCDFLLWSCCGFLFLLLVVGVSFMLCFALLGLDWLFVRCHYVFFGFRVCFVLLCLGCVLLFAFAYAFAFCFALFLCIAVFSCFALVLFLLCVGVMCVLVCVCFALCCFVLLL